MSLLGKILALLNMFGAVGLVYVAMLDYGKRQTWAYHYFRHELTLNGLPLSEADRDAENQPIVDRLGEELPKELFNPVGGNPVSTQLEEIKRLQPLLDGKIQAAANKPQQTHLLARMLLPLADHYPDREQLLACRVHLENDAKVAALKNRCEVAFREALRPGVADLPNAERSFPEAFRLAFRVQGGPPADAFVTLLLAGLPEDRTKAASAKVEPAFTAALESQLATLQKRYAQLFADALGGQQTQSESAASTAAQKGAIARLLFGLSVFLAEEEILTGAAENRKRLPGSPDQAAYQNALVESEPYRMHVRRIYVLCGLRTSLEAISERAGVLRRLGGYVQESVGRERLQFLFDHAAILEQLREHAAVVRDEQLHIADNEKRLEEYSQVVKLRTKEIEDLTADLKTSRGQTKEEIDALRKQSEKVLELRIRVRDAIRDNGRGELRIRELEKKVRELEK